MTPSVFARSAREANPATVPTLDQRPDAADEDIRCPLCGWRPGPASRWCCECVDTPEPFFDACGTVWNTFATRGRCPGCQHQWQWTTCLSCLKSSPHEAWYQRSARPLAPR
jgi:hypothetical protein